MDHEDMMPIWIVDVFEEALRHTPEGPDWDILDQLAVENGKVVIAETGEALTPHHPLLDKWK
jgi:hypothetical protein